VLESGRIEIWAGAFVSQEWSASQPGVAVLLERGLPPRSMELRRLGAFDGFDNYEQNYGAYGGHAELA